MIMSSKIYRAKMSLAEEEHRVDEEQGAGGGIDLPSLASKMEQVDLFDLAVDTFGDGAQVLFLCSGVATTSNSRTPRHQRPFPLWRNLRESTTDCPR